MERIRVGPAGYYRNAEATRKLFDKDWLDSGDLGYMASGELYVSGRIKDLIIRGGRNIYPYELEELVGNIKGVRQGCVAVFGVSAEQGDGERSHSAPFGGAGFGYFRFLNQGIYAKRLPPNAGFLDLPDELSRATRA